MENLHSFAAFPSFDSAQATETKFPSFDAHVPPANAISTFPQHDFNATKSATINIATWTPPDQQEKQYYELLFQTADEEKQQSIGGRIAVAFLTRSNVEKATLRDIWNFANVQQSGKLSKSEFYVALRLISMAQRGEKLTMERFSELATSSYHLPVFNGISCPSASTPILAAKSHLPVAASAIARGFVVTEDEKKKYEAIFTQTDVDHDGFVSGAEAVGLFQKSGLDRRVLREIWNLADRTQDGQLNSNDFCVAMHLIVCVSKRGLSLPAVLPTELESAIYSTNVFTPNHAILDTQVPHHAAEARDPMDAFDRLSSSQEQSSGVRHRGQSVVEIPSSLPAHISFPSVSSSTDRASFSGVSSVSMGTSFAAPSGMTSLPSTPLSSAFGSFTGMPLMVAPTNVVGLHAANTATANQTVGTPSRRMSSSPSVSSGDLLSQEGERSLVKQLEQANEQVHAKLADSESKQLSIESLLKKVREIDQLRHELIGLAIRRDKAREAKTCMNNGTSPATLSEDMKAQAEITKNLEEMIQYERLVIEKLQTDISDLEKKRSSAVHPHNPSKDKVSGWAAPYNSIPVIQSAEVNSGTSQVTKPETAGPAQVQIEDDPFFASFTSPSSPGIFAPAPSSTSTMPHSIGSTNDAFANFGFE